MKSLPEKFDPKNLETKKQQAMKSVPEKFEPKILKPKKNKQ